MLQRIRKPRVALAALLSLLVLGTPAAVLAGHRFSDVSASYPFHDEIDSIAEAGISTGWDDGTFRPGDNVRRGPMAAFMDRGLSGTAAEGIPQVVVDDTYDGSWPYIGIGSIEVTVPGVDGVQFLHVTANVTLKPSQGCPCEVTIALVDDISVFGRQTETVTNAHHGLSLSTVVPAASGPKTVQLLATVQDVNTAATEAVIADDILLTALSAPMWLQEVDAPAPNGAATR